jgi:hypothetical protein
MPSSAPATATANRASLSRSASSARLRWVASTVEPAMRNGRPSASRKHCARVCIQRTLAARTMIGTHVDGGVRPAR